MIRALVLVAVLLPFVFYAGRDTVAHFRIRKPSWKENVIHLVLGVQQIALVIGAFKGSFARMAVAGVGVAIAGAMDEWGFHHDLPAEESDLHAKSHFALFIFAMVAIAFATFSSPSAMLDAATGNAP